MVVLGVFLGAVAILLTAWLYARSVDARQQIAAEGMERRDQTCVLFEREHLRHVIRLERTYDYLDGLPRRERGSSLTRAVVRQLPELEVDARTDSAPPFCDEPGVGLPEPDPEPPAFRSFEHLLKRP
jgi:hypothetical protein